MDISVIVCAHNPRRDYLTRVLGALSAQTLPTDAWELVLVDNASKEPLAGACDLSWHAAARHVREEELGATPARLRGIAEARGELLVYVDDDTTITPTYLKEALILAERYPYLGVFGAGIVEPEYEVPPPLDIRSHAAMLSVRNVRTARWSNNVDDPTVFPWGAGLCLRRPVAIAYRAFMASLEITKVIGRRGTDFFAGEDDLFSWVSASIGLGFGVFPQLRVTHLIAANRLNRRYLLKLMHDHAFSHAVLRYVLTGDQPQRTNGFGYVHLALHGLRNGSFSVRCRLAESRALDRAARFIVARGLQQTTRLTAAREPVP
jgi:glycosyltransferase involved in cell wall biosynthesis